MVGKIEQPLFDFDGSDLAAEIAQAELELEDLRRQQHKWTEVHQDTFLSWSEADQLRYCIRRDLDSARVEPAQSEFYAARAAAYQADLDRLT